MSYAGNVYGMKIIRRGDADATARGALIVAATAMKLFNSVEQAFEEINNKQDIKEYFPNEQNVLLYKRYRTQMNQIYSRIWGKKDDDLKLLI